MINGGGSLSLGLLASPSSSGQQAANKAAPLRPQRLDVLLLAPDSQINSPSKSVEQTSRPLRAGGRVGGFLGGFSPGAQDIWLGPK